MLTIFYRPFRNSYKLGMWAQFRPMIEKMFSPSCTSDALLIGNYGLGRLDFDAILVVGTKIYLYEFKTTHTRKIIITKEAWLDDKCRKIHAGRLNDLSPLFQLRRKRNVLRSVFNHHGCHEIQAVALFPEDFELLKLSEKPSLASRPWFAITSLSRCSSSIIQSLDKHSNNNHGDMLESIKDYFMAHHSDYLICKTTNIIHLNHRGVLDFGDKTAFRRARA